MMKYMKHSIFIAALLFMFMRSACVTTTNGDDVKTQNMNYYIGIGGNQKAREKLLTTIRGAKTEIVGVFNDLADTEVSSALIERANAGVKVAIGGDRRNKLSAGFAALTALNGNNQFLNYKDATAKALAETNLNYRNKILATRLNFNRLQKSLKYDASPYDGRVEYNFVVADQYNCWVSTGGANNQTFSTGMSIVFVFQSYDICHDFYNEGNAAAYGGVFGDEGIPSFGNFANNKSIVDPNTRFRIGDLIFNIYFAPQEKPMTAVITELMRAENSIKFAARALTQDVINDVNTHASNRSHMLNLFQYKSTIPSVYKQNFTVSGVVGTEVDSQGTRVPDVDAVLPASGGSWSAAGSYTALYNALVSSTCAVDTNTIKINLPYFTGSTSSDGNGTTFCNTTNAGTVTCNGTASTAPTNGAINRTSIHCDLNTLQTSVNDASLFKIKKHASNIPFNVFLTDYNWRKPRLIIMSSDLRKRYFFDPGHTQDAEPLRTQGSYFTITDAFVVIIEPAGSTTDKKIFNDFNELINTLVSQGGSL